MGSPSFGILHDFRQPLPHAQSTDGYYAECLAEVEAADRLGFSCIWLSEHHGTDDGFLPSPLALAAGLAVRTERIQIGTNIVALPLHHPVRVAEDAAVVDLLSGGRFVLGVGQGYASREFALLGVDRSARGRRLEEGVAIIRHAWDEGTTGFDGREWRLPDVPFSPIPQRRVPILIGAVADKAVDRAVRIGDGLLVYCGAESDLPPRARQLEQALAAHGRSRAGFRFVATGILHVDEDAERAWQDAAPGIAYLEAPLARDRGAPPPQPRREEYLVGTPDDVAARLVALHVEAGFDHFAHWARLPGLTHEQALRTLHLVAEHVIPQVRARAAGA